MTTKKCTKCGEVKEEEDFAVHKQNPSGRSRNCRKCHKEWSTKYGNTEIGFLKKKYNDIISRCRINNLKCYFTVDKFLAAFEKHKSIYGMKSAWGPGIDHLDQHLPITMISKADSSWSRGEGKRTASNVSVDRLDSNMDYTLQNLIFIRTDENRRKSDSSYEDCKIHMRLHEERFIKMKAI